MYFRVSWCTQTHNDIQFLALRGGSLVRLIRIKNQDQEKSQVCVFLIKFSCKYRNFVPSLNKSFAEDINSDKRPCKTKTSRANVLLCSLLKPHRMLWIVPEQYNTLHSLVPSGRVECEEAPYPPSASPPLDWVVDILWPPS